MKKILGIGNALVDKLVKIGDESLLEQLALPKGSMQLIDTENYLAISQRMASMSASKATGGSAGNTILALGNLQTAPGFIGKVSDDENGHFFADNCLAHGITPFLLKDELPTGVASTFITPDGQRTFATYLGTAACLKEEEMKAEWFEGYDYFYIEGYLVQNHALIEHAVDLARAAGLKVCLDLASYNIVEADRDFFAHLLSKTDVVFANEEEARAFTGLAPREALTALAALCEVAVVKVGADGAWAQRAEEVSFADAMPVAEVVDTTGAGDFFAAGFLYALAQERSLKACLQAGAVLSGEVIQVIGTTLPESTWHNIRAAVQ